MQLPVVFLFFIVAQSPAVAAGGARRDRLRSRDTGAPVMATPVFDSEDPVQVAPVSGFCLKQDNSPQCTSVPCCCWSTFAQSAHLAYPNEEEASDGRRCLNPPGGYAYIRQPGFTHDDGHLASLGMDNAPRFPGRDLCCLISADDPAYYSMREPAAGATGYRDTQHVHHIIEEEGMPLQNAVGSVPAPAMQRPGEIAHPIFAPASAPAAAVAASPVASKAASPGPAGPAGPLPSVKTDMGTLLVNQDYETLQMEEAARANLRSAEILKASAASMSQSIADISEVKTQLATNPELLRRKQRVQEMREAVRIWAGKRWHNLQHMALGDAAGMVH